MPQLTQKVKLLQRTPKIHRKKKQHNFSGRLQYD